MEYGEIIEVTKETISSHDIKNICEKIKKNRVQALTLRDVKITDKDYKNLLKHVSTTERVRHLSLSLGVVSDHFRVQLLGLCVQRNSSLTALFVHGNTLFDAGIQVLVPCIRYHPRLVCIDVGDSEIGDEGLMLLCTLIPPSEHTRGLCELVLTHNPAISDKGWTQLGLTLTKSTNLRVLYVDYNQLTEVSASCLVMAVVTSSVVETLDMECTGITEATGQLVLQLLNQKLNHTLKSLNLLDNSIAESTLNAITMLFPDDTDGLKKDNDYLSDDELSLATSEPPLHEDDFHCDAEDDSEINARGYILNSESVVGRTGKQHEGNYSELSTAVVDRKDGSLMPSDYIKFNGNGIKPEAYEKISIKSPSLADRIKLRQLSCDIYKVNATTEVHKNKEQAVRSSSVGDIPQGIDKTSIKEDRDNSQFYESTCVKTDGIIKSDKGENITAIGKNYSESAPFHLIPESPSVVSLHKYQANSKGQDDGIFEPMNIPVGQRPCSAPLNVTQTNPCSNSGIFQNEKKTETERQSTAVRNILFSSQNLQFVDTRRRLSCESILQTSGKQSKRLSVGHFHRAYSLQTPYISPEEQNPQNMSPSAQGSPERDNIRRRLSSASIHPVRLQKQASALSADSNSTLGDISLEELT